MGFRSTFAFDDRRQIEWPSWFIEKYKGILDFEGVLSARYEAKTYGSFKDLPEDIRKAVDWSKLDQLVLVYLHECGGITRCQIREDGIKLSEPVEWKETEDIEHWYCYGCSDVED
jgi:hypothetical protein